MTIVPEIHYGDERLPERFWAKVDVQPSGCWNWTGSLKNGPKPYGFFNYEGKTRTTHRLAYNALVGDIPPKMVIDHACHEPRCVNPAHLQVTTQKQNLENRAGPDRDSTSGMRGVYWSHRKKKWTVQAVHHGRTHHGPYFTDKEEANLAAIALRNRLFTNNLTDPREEAA